MNPSLGKTLFRSPELIIQFTNLINLDLFIFAKMAIKAFVKHVFTIFATYASLLGVITNLLILLSIICKKYHIIMHFLPKKHWPKRALFAQRFPKVRKSRQISQQNSVCKGLKFSSESKLSVEGPSCPRTTSATVIVYKGTLQKLLCGFCPLREGGTPLSAKLFWAQWLSVKGGGVTPLSVKEKTR